jgi:8-oxo-dGTP diphosphatase
LRDPLLIVAAALIDGKGRLLLQQRPAGKTMAGLWEFPGGKIEPDETPEEALARELAEELGIAVATVDLAAGAFSSEALGERHLLLLLYLCRAWTGEPQALEGGALRWVDLGELDDLPMPPADRPLIGLLEKLIRL